MNSQLPPEALNLLNYWKGPGARLNPGASEERLATVTQEIGAPLPTALSTFYTWADGMEDGTTDGAMFCLWPLTRVLHEHSRAQAASSSSKAQTLSFADYLLDSHWYSVVLAGPQAGSIVADVNPKGMPPEMVGVDFFDFLTRLWSEPASVYVTFPR
jgi:hypothetical protein